MSDQDKLFNIPSIDVLMNRGVGTLFCTLKSTVDPDTGKREWQRAIDANGEVITEPGYIRLTNWTLALIDLPVPLGFGGLSAWQEMMRSTPTVTFARTIALMDEVIVTTVDGVERADAKYGALRMLDNNIAVYSLCFVNALMLAQGVPPEKAKASAEKAYRDYQKKLNEGVSKLDSSENDGNDDATIQTDPSNSISHTSNDSTQTGQSLVASTMSSGS